MGRRNASFFYTMTKSQLIIDFKNMIGPAGKGSEVDNTGILYWINEAYTIAVSKITEIFPDYYIKNSTASSVASQIEYALPSDFEKAIGVSVSYDGTTYRKALALNNIDQADPLYETGDVDFTQSQPYYYIAGSKIGILPAPSSTLSNNIKLWYSYVPSELALDADVPELPKRMQFSLKYWAYANYLDQNDEHVAAERMRQRFDNTIDSLVSQLADRQLASPKTVEIIGNADLYTSQYI